MFFYLGNNEFCKNGFRRKINDFYNIMLDIIWNENFDFLKWNFSEFFGDNTKQWSWHNVPGETRARLFPEKPVKINEYLQINGIDKIIEQKYLNEFFSWCVDGAIEYYKKPDFTPVGEMLDAQNEYIQEQSNISNYIDDVYELSCDDDMILKTEVKSNYDHWCKENSTKAMKMAQLYSTFDDKFGKSFKSGAKETKNKWVYRGLKLKLDEPVHDLDS
jgi:hypothetical protein